LEQQINCEGCGADLVYKPGAQGLTCKYCDHFMAFTEEASSNDANTELDLEHYLNTFEDDSALVEQHLVKCNGCGAETAFDEHQQSGACPFCDAALAVKQAHTKKTIKPKGLLPFDIERTEARNNFKAWLQKLWFAPTALKKQVTQHDRFKGVYLPFWTYDCDTHSRYTGQRGTYYYVTVNGRDKDGRPTSRQERRTRWSMTSGSVGCAFDDILVPATKSLPNDKLTALAPWDLHKLVDYKDEYLSGFIAETYQVDLKQGYQTAKIEMDDRIRDRIKRDIGGDQQRILSVSTRYHSATFKHILLPVWASSYRYRDKLYQVLVNARTGEVQAQRPWSWIKIAATVVTVLAIAGGGFALIQMHNSSDGDGEARPLYEREGSQRF